MKIAMLNVEISDQYGTCKDVLVGVYDNDENMWDDIVVAELRYSKIRTTVVIRDVELNTAVGETINEN